MGKKGIEIIGLDVKELIGLLNQALSDEWLAYYQYWVGAKIAKGPMRESVVEELEEHAADELKHANMLADRIIQLGGEPVLNPEHWFKQKNCKYEVPGDPHVKALLKQNITGERCAIDVYQKLADIVKGKDTVTFHAIYHILKDEVEHEDDLEAILEDIDLIGK